MDPGWSVSQDYPALGCYNARTVDRSLYTASLLLFSHTPELLTGLSSAAILHWVVVESYPGFNTGFYTGWRSRDE